MRPKIAKIKFQKKMSQIPSNPPSDVSTLDEIYDEIDQVNHRLDQVNRRLDLVNQTLVLIERHQRQQTLAIRALATAMNAGMNRLALSQRQMTTAFVSGQKQTNLLLAALLRNTSGVISRRRNNGHNDRSRSRSRLGR